MNTTAEKTYDLNGVQFQRHGNRIVIPPQSEPIDLNLKQWSEVLTGLGFTSYLKDTSQTSGQ